MDYPHLSVLVRRRAEKYGGKVAIRYKDYGQSRWIPVTWNEFSACVRRTANALLACGVGEAENVGVFSQNKPECFYVDFGCYAVRAVTVPLYATSSAEQVRYIADDACIRLLFVGEQFQYDAAFGMQCHCRSLERLVIFDRSVNRDPRDRTSLYFDDFLTYGDSHPAYGEVEARTARASFDDLANILYTSGTTGEPRGVMLHHFNYDEAMRIHETAIPQLTENDVALSFLPLTHVLERAWTYLCFYRGAEVCVNLRPHEVRESLREVRPTAMCSVPRFWEKVYVAVHDRMAQESGLRRKLMEDALEVGRMHNIGYVRRGLAPPAWLRLKYKFYEKTVYAIVKKELGLERANFFPAAGAAVSDEVCSFVHSLGIFMLVGYGLTESTATVSCFRRQGFEVGSVGQIMPGVQVKIGEAGEILLKGRTIATGYYKKPEATAAAIDPEGWFHTGDAGYVRDGHLYLTDRIKDLFKTSNGKYVSPQALETRLAIDRYIDQIAVIADGRKFVSALIVPVYGYVEAYAREKGISWNTREELLQHPKVQALFRARIDTLQQPFAHFEQIKRFTLLPNPFSMESGELTNTLKLRRKVVAEHYKEEIGKMYEES